MSGHASAAPKTIGTRLIQALALGVTFAVLYGVSKVAPELDSHVGTIAAVGFLLLSGTLMSELLETVGLPHLTGYLLAGIVGGPHVLHLVDHHTVEQLSPVNTLALSLIALAGGAELRITTLREVARSLAWATLIQSLLVLTLMTGVFVLLAPYLPFTEKLGWKGIFGVALLWGVLAITRSPSACMAILSQTRAKGPVATFSLAFIMLSDVVVLLLLAAAVTIARPLIIPGAGMSLDDFSVLGHELLGSVAVGTTFGLILAVYLRLVGRQLLLVLLGIGFGLTEALRYVHFDPLLAFLSAGFVVQNLSGQGQKLLHAVEQTGSVVFVVFFATAGAHLDLPLLKKLWVVAVVLCATRVLFTYIASRISSRLADDAPVTRKWGWMGLVSQAGLALGVAVVIERSMPVFEGAFRSLAIAAIAINEMVGPILFKFALDRAGETDTGAEEIRPSLTDLPEEGA